MLGAVISIPHCSLHVPEEIRLGAPVDVARIRSRIDYLTDRLFHIPEARCSVRAEVCRFVADVNRPAKEIARGIALERPAGGAEPRLTYRPLAPGEIIHRYRRYWRPYHREFSKALADPRVRFFIDAHAMEAVGPDRASDAGRGRPDFVLGNRGGADGRPAGNGRYVTAPADWLELARETLLELFAPETIRVELNRPYAGGYITRRYGNPRRRGSKRGFQIEVNKRLYLDDAGNLLSEERCLQINECLRALCRRLDAATVHPAI
ncbi:MAG: N-formylglutamate amidohydrolase [Vicinamibacteria bacterium]